MNVINFVIPIQNLGTMLLNVVPFIFCLNIDVYRLHRTARKMDLVSSCEQLYFLIMCQFLI